MTLEGATRRIDQAMTSIDGRFDDLRAKMTGVDAKMDALLARPACATFATFATTGVPRTSSLGPSAASSSAADSPSPAPEIHIDSGTAHARVP